MEQTYNLEKEETWNKFQESYKKHGKIKMPVT